MLKLKNTIGMGLRKEFYNDILSGNKISVDWFEIISENYMNTEGKPVQILDKVRRDFPIALHGVSLSIGSTEDLNFEYLKELKKLISRVDPFVISDHLCFGRAGNTYLHDLLPLPFNEETLNHVVSNVIKVQDYLNQEISLENVSSYLTYKNSDIPEWDFLRQVSEKSGCKILLDVNNIYVNAYNHKFNAVDYISNIPTNLVSHMHLAGFTDMGTYLFDTHSNPVSEEVWALFELCAKEMHEIPVMIEWDEDIPEYSRVEQEILKAKEILLQAVL